MSLSRPGLDSTDRLRSIIERIESLQSRRAAISHDIQALMRQAQASGFDPAIVRQVLRVRRSHLTQALGPESLHDLFKEAVRIECHESWF